MNIDKENVIRIQAYLSYVRYPKYPKELGKNGDNWGTVVWKVNKVYSGEVTYMDGRENEILIVGSCYNDPLEYDKAYTIVAKETIHPTYGFQYELMSIVEEIDFSNLKNQETFLKMFCTDSQIEEMYKIFESPIEIIAAHDIQELTKVKGIGEYLAGKIIERFDKHKDRSKAYIELADYDLTPALIDKIVSYFGNETKAISILKILNESLNVSKLLLWSSTSS
jgi:hypothetical protein